MVFGGKEEAPTLAMTVGESTFIELSLTNELCSFPVLNTRSKLPEIDRIVGRMEAIT